MASLKVSRFRSVNSLKRMLYLDAPMVFSVSCGLIGIGIATTYYTKTALIDGVPVNRVPEVVYKETAEDRALMKKKWMTPAELHPLPKPSQAEIVKRLAIVKPSYPLGVRNEQFEEQRAALAARASVLKQVYADQGEGLRMSSTGYSKSALRVASRNGVNQDGVPAPVTYREQKTGTPGEFRVATTPLLPIPLWVPVTDRLFTSGPRHWTAYEMDAPTVRQLEDGEDQYFLVDRRTRKA